MISEVIKIEDETVYLKDKKSGMQLEIRGQQFTHLQEGELLAYNYITTEKSDKPVLALFSFNKVKGVCLPSDMKESSPELDKCFDMYLDALARELACALPVEQIVKYECEYVLGVQPTRVFKNDETGELVFYFINNSENTVDINNIGIDVYKHNRLEHFIEHKLRKSKSVHLNNSSELVLDDVKLPVNNLREAFFLIKMGKLKQVTLNNWFSLRKTVFGIKIKFNAVSRYIKTQQTNEQTEH